MPELFSKKNLTLLAYVLLLGILVYLPFLGSRELQGNEARRIMPAQTMLQNGDWIVPELAGEKYYKKPPLINWLIASSFILNGNSSEFSARIVSALMTILFASLLVLLPSGWLSIRERCTAAVVFLTSYGTLLFGRMIEIEAAYTVITGLAILLWLNMESLKTSQWLQWPIVGIVLGLGLLMKGPIILLFFYVPVIAVLLYSHKAKRLLNPAHFASVVIMLAIFLVWAYKMKELSPPQAHVSGTWKTELLDQLNLKEFDFGKWANALMLSVGLFAPWIVFLPLITGIRKNLVRSDEFSADVFKGLCTGILICFVLVNLMPGTEDRYSAPILPMFSFVVAFALSKKEIPDIVIRIWSKFLVFASFAISALGLLSLGLVYGGVLHDRILALPSVAKKLCFQYQPLPFYISVLCLAVVFSANFAVWRNRRRLLDPSSLVLASGSVFVSLVMIFYFLYIPIENSFARKRQMGNEIGSSAPEKSLIHVLDIGYMPFFYYVPNQKAYIYSFDRIGDDVEYLMMEDNAYEDMLKDISKNPSLYSGRKPIEIKEASYKRKTYKIVRMPKQ